jgi:hypothetical protein
MARAHRRHGVRIRNSRTPFAWYGAAESSTDGTVPVSVIGPDAFCLIWGAVGSSSAGNGPCPQTYSARL